MSEYLPVNVFLLERQRKTGHRSRAFDLYTAGTRFGSVCGTCKLFSWFNWFFQVDIEVRLLSDRPVMPMLFSSNPSVILQTSRCFTLYFGSSGFECRLGHISKVFLIFMSPGKVRNHVRVVGLCFVPSAFFMFFIRSSAATSVAVRPMNFKKHHRSKNRYYHVTVLFNTVFPL